MSEPSQFTRTTAVPTWMVHLMTAFLTVLSAGAVGTLVSLVNWGFWLQHEVGELKREQGSSQVKQADFTAAINSLQIEVRTQMNSLKDDVQALQRTVDVIKARNGDK